MLLLSSLGVLLWGVGALAVAPKPSPYQELLDEIFKTTGVAVKLPRVGKSKEKVILPKITKEIQHKWGTRLLINLPYGISSDAVVKHAQAISEGLRKEINISYDNGLVIDVFDREMPESIAYHYEPRHDYKVPIGANRRGAIRYYDFTGSFPHLLIAGISGGGKSVTLRTILTSLSLGPRPPHLYLIDLKGGVELGLFRHLQHVKGFATTLLEANNLLEAAEAEMYRRYNIMARDDAQEWKGKPLIIVMDELADLRIRSKDNLAPLKNAIKAKLSTISAKGRAARTILVLATQRPSADIVEGTIKTNIATSICFRTRDDVQSRIILDHTRAADLPDVSGRCFFQQSKDEILQTFYLPYDQAKQLLINVPRRGQDECKPAQSGSLDRDFIQLG